MVEDFIRRSQGAVTTEAATKSFSLEPKKSVALPLVNESTKLKLSEGGAQNYLLNRNRLNLVGDN
jgi:hypothetical protein